MGKISYFLKCIISKLIPIIKNTVFFDSFNGQYNDNPKYISEELHKQSSLVNIVWSISDKSREIPPSYVKTVQYGSKEYYKYIMSSAVIVDNHMGLKNFGFRNFHSKLLFNVLKKRKQLSISTWHGTPLKKIGRHQLRRPAKTFLTSTDYCVYGCDITRDFVGDAFFVTNLMKPYGTPRNDRLVKRIESNEISRLKKKLHLPEDKSIILFAPTFRESIELSGIKQLEDLSIDTLLNKLYKRFGKHYAFVFRSHHSVQQFLQESNELKDTCVIDGNIGDDMTEYLLCTDILLTDYSSSMFDFALTKKPCFLYVPDYDHYKNDERGFYFDFNNLPFPSAFSTEQLLQKIETFEMEKYVNRVEDFLNSINNIEKGNASSLVAKDIINHLKSIN